MQPPAEFIPISALQHYLFCPRQCALIHLEQLWTENVYTAEGRQLHEKAHANIGRLLSLPVRERGLKLNIFNVNIAI